MTHHEADYAQVMAQLVKQQDEAEQQRIEFKTVLDQLVLANEENRRLREERDRSTTEPSFVPRADFNRVLEELTRDRDEARKLREEAKQEARQRVIDNKERESFYQTMLKQQNPQANANITDTPFEVTKKLEEQQKEISKLHQLLKVLQQNNAVTNPGQVVPVDNLPSLIAPQEATTTTIITPTTPIPTNNSSSVVNPEHSPAPPPTTEITVHTTPIINSQTYQIQQTKDEWQSAAELLYSKRSNSHLKNYEHVTDFLAANPSLFEPLLERCPNIGLIIAHLLKLRLGLTVQNVSWTSSISDWNGEDCRRVGCSAAGFLRNFQTGEAALEAWKLHYVQVRERSERALWKTRKYMRDINKTNDKKFQ